jgi:hypothetical protein
MNEIKFIPNNTQVIPDTYQEIPFPQILKARNKEYTIATITH